MQIGGKKKPGNFDGREKMEGVRPKEQTSGEVKGEK